MFVKPFLPKSTLLLFGLFLGLVFLPSVKATTVAVPSKDVVIVVDNSKSMVGLGGAFKADNVFSIVKNEVTKVVDNLQSGDTLTLMEFGEQTRVVSRFSIPANNKEEILQALNNIKATANWTYTAEMIRNLSSELKTLEDASGSRVQLAMIFSDAIDDPPPANSKDTFKLGNGAGDTARCAVSNQKPGTKNVSRFVYFYSLNKQPIGQALANTLVECFPDIKIESVLDKEKAMQQALEKAREQALRNQIPAIDLKEEVPTFEFTFKAGEEAEIKLELVANDKANGKAIQATVQDDPSQPLSLVQTDAPLVLQAGANTLTLKVTMPYRVAPDYTRKVVLSPVSDQENFFFLPNNKGELYINIKTIPLTLAEKFQKLPEYYIPLILVILALLYALYHFYKYLTFRPVLKLYFWDIEQRKTLQQLQKEKDSLPKEEILVDVVQNLRRGIPLKVEFNPELQKVKYFVDVLKLEENQKMMLTSKEEVDSENTLVVQLETLGKNDDVVITKINRGRKSRFRIDQASLMKLRNRKFFRGMFLRNKTSFQIGGKEFYMESNLK